MMKWFLISSILVSTAVSLPSSDMQTCITAVTDLMAIVAQADPANLGLEDLEGFCDLAAEQVLPQLDVEGCKDFMQEHYEAVVAAVQYVASTQINIDPADICSFPVPSCDECVGFLSWVGDMLDNVDFSQVTPAHLEEGCELAAQQYVQEIDVDECKDLVKEHFDAIMASIEYVADSAADATPEEYCTYAGVCVPT